MSRETRGREPGELSPREIFNKLLGDPSFLPTRDQLFAVFPDMRGKSFGQKMDIEHRWTQLVQGSEVPDLEGIDRGEHQPQFEILTKEYIDGLARYLAERLRALGTKKDAPLNILEVGAGNGRLSHFLRQAIENQTPHLAAIIAADPQEGPYSRKTRPLFPVQKFDTDEALTRYQPAIVISSWMPNKIDLTPLFRQTPSVKEYILIGEPELCGTSDSWWPVDDFEEIEHPDLEQLQICRTDNVVNREFGHSATTSFIKKQ